VNSLQDNRTKPDRALPRVWRRFYAVRAGESFDFKGRTFVNRGIFGLPIEKLPLDMEHGAWIFPWTRVRTHTLVREKLCSYSKVAREIDDRLRKLDDEGATMAAHCADVAAAPRVHNDDNRTGSAS